MHRHANRPHGSGPCTMGCSRGAALRGGAVAQAAAAERWMPGSNPRPRAGFQVGFQGHTHSCRQGRDCPAKRKKESWGWRRPPWLRAQHAAASRRPCTASLRRPTRIPAPGARCSCCSPPSDDMCALEPQVKDHRQVCDCPLSTQRSTRQQPVECTMVDMSNIIHMPRTAKSCCRDQAVWQQQDPSLWLCHGCIRK